MKLNIEALITNLELMRIRLYDMYVYTLDIGLGDMLLSESNNLKQIIEALKKISPGHKN
jgi:hypothetical protein